MRGGELNRCSRFYFRARISRDRDSDAKLRALHSSLYPITVRIKLTERQVSMRVADAIFHRLETETDCVFFVPGGGAMFLVDALGRSGLKHVSAVHEQGAGAMALGYAMTSGRLGVCLTTAGPGATNAITPCLAAWTDSIPVLFISGQARSNTLVGQTGLRTRGVQEADIVRMVQGITKVAYEPLVSGHDCLMALEDMIVQCLSGRRGPCWLSVPQDVQGMNL